VTVEERVNGSMLITLSGVRLEFRQITARPQKEQKLACKARHRKGHTPPVDHPWNKWNGRLFRQMRGHTNGQWLLPHENRTFLFCLDIRNTII
jgi:hypothetical protein